MVLEQPLHHETGAEINSTFRELEQQVTEEELQSLVGELCEAAQELYSHCNKVTKEPNKQDLLRHESRAQFKSGEVEKGDTMSPSGHGLHIRGVQEPACPRRLGPHTRQEVKMEEDLPRCGAKETEVVEEEAKLSTAVRETSVSCLGFCWERHFFLPISSKIKNDRDFKYSS